MHSEHVNLLNLLLGLGRSCPRSRSLCFTKEGNEALLNEALTLQAMANQCHGLWLEVTQGH